MSSRDDLLDATRSLLWERGYEAMSPRMILRRSGAGQGSLYHHFEGKKDLAAQALDVVEADMRRALADTLQDLDRPPLERVLAWLDAPREALKGCRLGRLSGDQSVVEDADLRQPLARYFEATERALRAALEEAVRQGALPPGTDAAGLAAMLLSVVQGAYVTSRALQDPEQMATATQAARASLLRLSSSK